jgi:hypothetical protein
MEFIYLLKCSDWEDMIIFLTKEEAIQASIKSPNSRVEIFSRTDCGYLPTYDFYKNGSLYKCCDNI